MTAIPLCCRKTAQNAITFSSSSLVEERNGHQSLSTACREDKGNDVLRAQRCPLFIVIAVVGVVSVLAQRCDTHYRNDPNEHGLDK